MKNRKGISIKKKRYLIMTAVQAERDAVLRGLAEDNRFDVHLAGVGPMSAAAKTAAILANNKYDLVISAGIAGGFPGRAEIGSMVISNEIVSADLGAETSEGFLNIEKLGFGSSRIPVDQALAEKLTTSFSKAGLPSHLGAILTLSTVTGTAGKAEELMAREHQAVAEAMEGFGVATAANDRGIPVMELRSISNPVGPRNRETWQIKEALQVLEKASSIIAEVL